MAKRKTTIRQAEIVLHFAAKLRELRHSHGLTQAQLAREAKVTTTYMWRLESGAVAPGIDLVARLAKALGTTTSDLLPATGAPDTVGALKTQAQRLFESLMESSDQDFYRMLNPLLARLVESSNRTR